MGYRKGKIYNLTNGEVVFTQGVLPTDFWSRFRGLQWRRELREDEAWWFKNCSSVHTFGMRHQLDVLHLTAEGKVIKINRCMNRRRISISAKGRSVIEMKSGMAKSKGLELGIFLGWHDE
ncbi:DUF192 domain-containing protein [Halomonas sp. CUBES01]|jgi:Uncharacterized conserved protein|uniref:DUF192 domain-containing protein n=1 Tax=Halomonas sp. CUBES01 TaxID=2897340 RepID=UPI001E426DA7|nr:DUF192 domain-containing protein [Halomonas sp. CUBES01]MEC4766141.1 DUF192 domain-containing protein [Halomonas sp. CUBES01]